MKTFLILLMLFFSNLTFSQAPAIAWQKTFGGDQADLSSSIKHTTDGGYIICGESVSGISGDKTTICKGGYDYWVIKTNSIGTIEWQKNIGGSLGDGYGRIQQTTDQGYIIYGSSISDISGDKTQNSIMGINGPDYWIVKLDSLGNVQWDKTIGGTDWDECNSLLQTPDGGYLLAGKSCSRISGNKTEDSVHQFPEPEPSSYDFWIVKLDSTGNVQWDKTIGGYDWDIPNSTVNASDGGYIIAGYSFSNISGNKTENSRGGSDFWIVKINESGSIMWQKTIGGNHLDELNAIITTADGGYLVGGVSDSDISGEKTENAILTTSGSRSSDFWVLKLDVAGNILWQKTIGGSASDGIYSICEDSTGNFLLAGGSFSNISADKTENSRGGSDFWLVKTDNTGTILWDKTLGGAQNEEIYQMDYVASDNSSIITGSSLSSNTGDKTGISRGINDYWIVKLAPENLAINNFSANNFQVYPNPTINNWNFTSSNEAITSIQIIDVLGKVILTTKSTSVDAAALSAGIYFARIATATAYETVRLIKN